MYVMFILHEKFQKAYLHPIYLDEYNEHHNNFQEKKKANGHKVLKIFKDFKQMHLYIKPNKISY